jgi:peptidoglycan hydrolase-like protein with peptidoglycan-binding domain
MMRNLLAKKSVCGLMAATLTAGAWSVPALGSVKQSLSADTGKSTTSKTAHKSTTQSTSHASSSATKTRSSNPAATKTTSGKSSKGKKSRTKKVKGQQAPTPERISEIQEALASKGAFSGTPNGVWDDSTADAVKKFQTSHGLTPTGKLDALTLQKLGLGSETSGVAPPVVPPDTENRLRSSSAPAASAEPR